MNLFKTILIVAFSIGLFSCTEQKAEKKETVTEQFKPEWSSLRKHQTPQWLVDGKFGIYSHWGIWTIQYAEGYMGSGALPLDEAISKFKAENFDAAEWAKLFKNAGAKFGGPVGWHGSKYLHWNSDLTDYTSVKMLPHRDIVGESAIEMRKQGLKTFISLHWEMDNDQWIDYGKEVVDKYHPDLFWVDAGFGGTKGANHQKVLNRSKFIGEGKSTRRSVSDKHQREFLSHYFNDALKQNKEVEFIYKSYDIPPGVGMRDLENGLLDHTAYDVWMTDMDMNICPDWETHGWFYRDGIPLRDTNNIVDMLVDVVSKNGVMSLNVPPLADGSFSTEIENTLLGVGEWLKINGEAIYGSTPWFIFGEGPVEIKSGNYTFHHNEHFGQHKFSEQDIRFTTNKEFLYAISLGIPDTSITIKALNTNFKMHKGFIKNVSIVGYSGTVKWIHNEEGLTVDIPNDLKAKHAICFKIETS
ncbi:alpha-L-fucosidase [uncultured Lutibacter sp.]|uniref:alpha-L-fucosidase n=1 Tax=uncultured Lutibacter sp. TaxID=437739 RepID=UPI0026084B27|nr:alpha-L-fucosidase [uncultured Lutibacter sp.]